MTSGASRDFRRSEAARYSPDMGEWLRKRALRALHLEHWWTHIEALSARLRRLEEDVENLQLGKSPFTPRPQTIRAAPPPPPNRKGDA